MDETTYYDLLGVHPTASNSDIKAAFRDKARRFHPDANPGDPVTAEKFKALSDAYATLADPERRAAYDGALNQPDECLADAAAPGDVGPSATGGNGWGTPTGSVTPTKPPDGHPGWGVPHHSPIASEAAADIAPTTFYEDGEPFDDGEMPDPSDSGDHPAAPASESRPYDPEPHLADQFTRLILAGVIVWIVATLTSASATSVGRDLRAVTDALGDNQVLVSDEKAEIYEDLATSVLRVLIVAAAGVATWTMGGAALYWHTNRPPHPGARWRPPSWDGSARLLQVAVLVGLGWLSTTVVMLPHVDQHVDAREVQAALRQAQEDGDAATTIAHLEAARDAANRATTANQWRVPTWLVLLGGCWIAAGWVPEHLGFRSRYERTLTRAAGP